MSNHTSAWIEEFRKHVIRGRHIVLHGNVFGSALFDGEVVPLHDALEQALRGCMPDKPALNPFKLIAWHNVIDGLHFSTKEELDVFKKLRITLKNTGGRKMASSVETVQAAEATNTQPRKFQLAPARPHDASNKDIAYIFDDMMEIRHVIAQSADEPFAIVCSYSEKLISAEENQNLDDRKIATWLVESAKAAFADYRHFAPIRNCLILVASKLGQVPAWIYRENPHFAVVEVKPPSLEERLYFFNNCGQWKSLYPSDQEREKLAILTDGETFLDLETLDSVVVREKIADNTPSGLVNYFRFGSKAISPWLSLKSKLATNTIRNELSKAVLGQELAIDKVIQTLVNAAGGISLDSLGAQNRRPKGVLFFVGPTGVGKTELAKSIAKAVFGDENNLIRFDMSEYKSESDGVKLIGAPPSYIGYGEGGQLTNAIRSKPFSLLLFDEIDKANPLILDKFLQILDDGRLTDGMGQTVDFSHTLIIFTSNFGSAKCAKMINANLNKLPSFDEIHKCFETAVHEQFHNIGRPEILGRIGKENIISFDILRNELVKDILEKFLDNIKINFARERPNTTLTIDDLSDICLAKLDMTLGGRAIRNFVNSEILTVLNHVIISHPIATKYNIKVDTNNNKITATAE